ncbi:MULTISPECIES: hypothetical protein [unclassified Rhodococcus (in: high G+C Gram-positive bacteria)]|jgi:hypothetical protein|uniref:hypothetical protein n=1 Tax=unclassified Rhodococcus (in: high G+C Gram-positive bacteria) TaxID=192944 RepID=UPI001AEA8E50|nr:MULTISPECIES: hypothetical protein [unclassified Rhodococcus (in: high G+C Gram-positive bacteria)]MBP2525402.1 hypothetical protein [Rhodococcus sp. PvP104]MDA3635971.1 hypothetical protein [Rhodococcus sp. C-2]
MEPLEPMRPVSVPADTHKSPIWKSAPVTLGTVGVFAYALMSARTGVVEVALGAAIAIAGAALYCMSVMRTIRENSCSRVPLLGTPPVSPRDVDLLAGAGMPLIMGGSLLAIRAAGWTWPYLYLGLLAVIMVATYVLPVVVHNRRLRKRTHRSQTP